MKKILSILIIFILLSSCAVDPLRSSLEEEAKRLTEALIKGDRESAATISDLFLEINQEDWAVIASHFKNLRPSDFTIKTIKTGELYDLTLGTSGGTGFLVRPEPNGEWSYSVKPIETQVIDFVPLDKGNSD
jgi:hypothetical protein